jgi:hypothetical protein
MLGMFRQNGPSLLTHDVIYIHNRFSFKENQNPMIVMFLQNGPQPFNTVTCKTEGIVRR